MPASSGRHPENAASHFSDALPLTATRIGFTVRICLANVGGQGASAPGSAPSSRWRAARRGGARHTASPAAKKTQKAREDSNVRPARPRPPRKNRRLSCQGGNHAAGKSFGYLIHSSRCAKTSNLRRRPRSMAGIEVTLSFSSSKRSSDWSGSWAERTKLLPQLPCWCREHRSERP